LATHAGPQDRACRGPGRDRRGQGPARRPAGPLDARQQPGETLMSSRTSVTNELRWRLGRRLDQQIAALWARDPGFQEHVRREARRRALQSLGLTELQAEWDALATQRQELARRRRRLRRALGAAVRRVAPADAANPAADRPEDKARRALQQLQVLHEREVLAEHERGQEVV